MDSPEAAAAQELSRLLHLDEQWLATVLPQPVVKERSPVFLTERDEDASVDDLDPAQAWFSGGSPMLVLVGVAKHGAITVAVPAVDWHGHLPVVRVDTVEVFDPAEVADLADALEGAVARSVEIRRSRFMTCTDCREVNPPEWMHNSLCQGGAQLNHGVVY